MSIDVSWCVKWASLIAQLGKKPPAMQETPVRFRTPVQHSGLVRCNPKSHFIIVSPYPSNFGFVPSLPWRKTLVVPYGSAGQLRQGKPLWSL